MGFTNIDLVKKHILEHELGTVSKENIACRLEGETPFQLPHILILSGSEKVKAKEQNIPTCETISFASSEGVQLAHQELIPDTVVVANDSSLGAAPSHRHPLWLFGIFTSGYMPGIPIIKSTMPKHGLKD